jgi:hypothetical protein
VCPMLVVIECRYSVHIVVHGEDALERQSRCLPLLVTAVQGARVDGLACSMLGA